MQDDPIFRRVIALIRSGEVKISDHGYDELAHDDLYSLDMIRGVADAVVVESYPTFPKGACVLVLQRDPAGRPVHVLWGIPKGHEAPAVLITAYRPDPDQWEPGFIRRRT